MKNNKLSKCRKQKIIRFVNYNKHKDIENWSRELLLYSPFKNSENSLLEHMLFGMMHIVK